MQLVKNLFYNQEVFDALSKTKLSAKKLEAIKNANIDNITTKDLMLVSGSIRKYTNGYEHKKADKPQMGNNAITCQVIPNSGHYPSKPAMDAVVSALQNMVKK